MAIGIVKRWARGGGQVDANTRAAAALAVKQWEEKKAKAHVSEAAVWRVREAERWVVENAIARLAVLEGRIGREGIRRLLDGRVLLEYENDSPGALVVEQLGEMARWDVLSAVSRIPSLGVLAREALAPVPLAEAFNAHELRNFLGRWARGGGSHPDVLGQVSKDLDELPPASKPPLSRARVTRPGPTRVRTPNVAFARYEGGVKRSMPRDPLPSRTPLRVEHKESLKGVAAKSDMPAARRAVERINGGVHANTQQVHAERDANGNMVRNAHGGVVYSEERKALHARIIEALLAGKQQHTGRFGPEAVFTAGGPASGKSSLIKAGHVRVIGSKKGAALGRDDMVHINPDIIRQMLPEYHMFQNAGRGEEAAGLTHEEASDLAKTLTRIAIARQHHVLVDGVGDSAPGKFAGKVKRLQEGGYRHVSVSYADVPIHEAISRADVRGDKSGRYVDHKTVVDSHVGVSARFGEVSKLAGVHVRVFDTSGPDSKPPSLMYEKKANQESGAIISAAGMRAFLAKGKLDAKKELARLVKLGIAAGSLEELKAMRARSKKGG